MYAELKGKRRAAAVFKCLGPKWGWQKEKQGKEEKPASGRETSICIPGTAVAPGGPSQEDSLSICSQLNRIFKFHFTEVKTKDES